VGKGIYSGNNNGSGCVARRKYFVGHIVYCSTVEGQLNLVSARRKNRDERVGKGIYSGNNNGSGCMARRRFFQISIVFLIKPPTRTSLMEEGAGRVFIENGKDSRF
jgi:hypothetical protein